MMGFSDIIFIKTRSEKKKETPLRNIPLVVIVNLCFKQLNFGFFRAMEDKQSIGVDTSDVLNPLEVHDFVPHFQRVSISGEDTSGVRFQLEIFFEF